MNLRSLRIGARLAIGFATVLALLALVVVGGNLMSEQSMGRLTRGLQAANAKGALAEKMKSALLEAAVSARDIGLQADVVATQGEEAKVREQRKRYAQARAQLEAIGLTDAEKELLANIARLDQEMEKPVAEAIGQALAFNAEGAAKVITASINPITGKSLVEINKLVEIQQAAAREVLDGAAASARSLHMLLYVLGAIAFAIGAVFSVVITRSIINPLRDAVSIATRVASGDLSSDFDAAGKDETADVMRALKDMAGNLDKLVSEVRRGTEAINVASKEIAQGNQSLSARTEEQASSLEETASSMEELTSTVKQNAENSRHANQLAAGASEVAVKGGQVVRRVVETMGGISESSKKIAEIISVIDGIAFQTNILALNAAVEAARAGEQGRGFAVVASEVRNLAQRSAAAAKEIKGLIGDSAGKVDAGAKFVDEAGRTMQEVVGAVKQVTEIITEITAASQEQYSGIEQVNQAITQMDHVTQQNSALVEEASSAAESMREQAAYLAQAVAVFRVSSKEEVSFAVSSAPARASAEPPAPAVKPLPKRELRALGVAKKPANKVVGDGDAWQEF